MFDWFKKRVRARAPGSTDTSPGGVYSGLRQQALSTNRIEMGIDVPSQDAPAWGILMETGYEEAIVTLLAICDGATFHAGQEVISQLRLISEPLIDDA